jgi:AraC-like DNA-binding protein
MKGSIVLGTLMILLATLSCYAGRYTLADANIIIVILIFIVIALIVMGCYSIRYNRIISQRNEQLRRILTALDEYRAIVGDEVLTLDEQEEILKKKLPKPKKIKVIQKDDEHNYFVMMDARINKEKPFTDPDFDQDALIQFMGVSRETFCKLVPRYTDPDRTLDYINSLRAEYAAKILMESSDYSMDDLAVKCGFRNNAAFNSAFKFSFGITPTEFLRSMSLMFKKKENDTRR